jgi:hypothetical protein
VTASVDVLLVAVACVMLGFIQYELNQYEIAGNWRPKTSCYVYKATSLFCTITTAVFKLLRVSIVFSCVLLGGPESIAPLFQMLVSRVRIIIFQRVFFCSTRLYIQFIDNVKKFI